MSVSIDNLVDGMLNISFINRLQIFKIWTNTHNLTIKDVYNHKDLHILSMLGSKFDSCNKNPFIFYRNCDIHDRKIILDFYGMTFENDNSKIDFFSWLCDNVYFLRHDLGVEYITITINYKGWNIVDFFSSLPYYLKEKIIEIYNDLIYKSNSFLA